jgi:hypothetical protein
MIDELERICKEAVMASSRYYSYPGVCLEELRKTSRNLTQYSWCSGRYSNQVPSEHSSKALRLNQLAWFL